MIEGAVQLDLFGGAACCLIARVLFANHSGNFFNFVPIKRELVRREQKTPIMEVLRHR